MILEVRARLAIVFSRNCHHQTNTCNQYCSVMTQWCTTQAANWPRRNPTPPLSGYWRDWQRPDFRGAALEHLVEPASWPMDGRPVKAACVRSCAPCCHLFKLSCYLSFVSFLLLGKERSCTCAPLDATSNDRTPDATARDLPFCSCMCIPTCIGTWTPTSCSGIEISCYDCYRIRSSLPLAHLYTWCYVVRPSLAPAKNFSCTFALAHLP